MDFYALQLSPKKKKDDKEKREEQIKKFREHVITKEELFADIESKNEKESDSKPDVKKSISPDFLSSKTFSLSSSEIKSEGTKINSSIPEIHSAKKEKELPEKKKPSEIWNFSDSKIGAVEEKKTNDTKEEGSMENAGVKDIKVGEEKPKKESLTAEQAVQVPELKMSTEEKVKIAVRESSPASSMDSVEIKRQVKSQVNVGREKKAIPTMVIGNKKIEQATNLSDESIIENFAQAILTNDNKKVRSSIEELILFRSKDPVRVNGEYELNIKLKNKLIEIIPALLAYKGGKSVLGLFQLLDQLNVKFTDSDLAKLPNEVLESQDLKSVCEKYLVWFAKEYPDFPSQLQDRIYYFNKCGIFSYKEIKGFSVLQLTINSGLVSFIRSNVQNPSEVERKIYEFALAGLVDDKEFKKESVVKRIVKKFISTLIIAKKDKPLEVSRKIGEYEEIGLIKTNEILEDNKIEKIIERYLLKFKREHRDHPRKVKSLIKDYFDAGLIDKKMRDSLLKN